MLDTAMPLTNAKRTYIIGGARSSREFLAVKLGPLLVDEVAMQLDEVGCLLDSGCSVLTLATTGVQGKGKAPAPAARE